MTEKQKVEELLEMVFKNSSEPYLKNGKHLVDGFDVKGFLVLLVDRFKLTPNESSRYL
jgi:hypothetical protein